MWITWLPTSFLFAILSIPSVKVDISQLVSVTVPLDLSSKYLYFLKICPLAAEGSFPPKERTDLYANALLAPHS